MSTLTTEFQPSKRFVSDQRGPIRWIWSHAIRHWPIALVALVGAFGNAALLAGTQVFIGRAFNAILAQPPQLNLLVQIALSITAFQVTRGILQFGRNFGFELIAQRIEREVRDELYMSLLGKSMTFHNLQPVGDTMARATNDVREVNFLFSPGINMVVGSLNFLIMPLLLAPRYHPSLVLTPVLFLVLYFVVLRSYLKSLAPVTDEVRASFGKLNTRLTEALDGIETVKGAAQEREEVVRFRNYATRYKNAAVRQGDLEARFVPLLMLGIALATGLLHALLLFQAGLLSVGDVVGYFGLLLMLDFPTFTSIFAYSQISLGVAGAKRILELMQRESRLAQNQTGYRDRIRGEIEFRDVSFAYDGHEPALEGLSFTVHPGQTVAVVGQTGAGKTTLARLINRTYEATGGTVFVDGVDVRDWDLEALRRGISIIEQDIFLFSRSIRENIAFGMPGAKDGEVRDAAASAQADDFIQTFQDGYDTIVGERGVTLSGGQRQRIALARAFLTDPRVLILDDSTSAIDSATEDRIQRAIFAAAQGRTTLIITHRLSQIRWADLILVMRNGRLAAIGTHDELLRTSEAYRRIFQEAGG